MCLRSNVNWFKLYEHTNYSVGIIYLVIGNLPRNKQFNIENIIIVGCIPGPKEPKLNINSFLKSMIEELVDGAKIKLSRFLDIQQFGACLLLFLQILQQHVKYVVFVLIQRDVLNV